MCVCSILSNSVTPWTAACHPPLSMEFSRQEYWSGLPFPTPGDLPTQGLNLRLLHWQADSLSLSHLGSPHVGSWGKLIEEKKKERESSFCAGATKLHASSWDACAEMAASSPEGGGVGPVTSRGHQGDICASLVGGLLNQS